MCIVPGVVPDIETVGDHQLRQARRVRVVALRATELMIHRVNRAGVGLGAPIILIVGIVGGDQRIEIVT